VEQKNWTLVRRLIGYQRLDTQDQLQWLDSLYAAPLAGVLEVPKRDPWVRMGPTSTRPEVR
jgi:hypothetical protein